VHTGFGLPLVGSLHVAVTVTVFLEMESWILVSVIVGKASVIVVVTFEGVTVPENCQLLCQVWISREAHLFSGW
jgi:hypothetical protein